MVLTATNQNITKKWKNETKIRLNLLPIEREKTTNLRSF